MAQADRQRLLERALALPHAKVTDFAGGRKPPPQADPDHLRRIDDTALRTKLVDVGLAEGLQSPKGPQKIASIVRIYPNFDAPRKASNGRVKRATAPARAARGSLPTLEEMERLIARIRDLEATVAGEIVAEADERIAHLKRSLGELDGDDLERTYRELGEALDRKRAANAKIRAEAFRRIESNTSIPERAYLRLLRR